MSTQTGTGSGPSRFYGRCAADAAALREAVGRPPCHRLARGKDHVCNVHSFAPLGAPAAPPTCAAGVIGTTVVTQAVRECAGNGGIISA